MLYDDLVAKGLCRCGRVENCKGMCPGHYARFRKHGDAFWDIPLGGMLPKPGRPECTVEDCHEDNHGNGLCTKHYARFLRRADGSTDDPVRALGCSEEDCEGAHHAKGLCNKHWARGRSRRNHLYYSFRMTEEQWDDLFESQGRRCPVCLCEEPPENWTRGWHVHHDHACCPGDRSCGECVVAILCGPCNVGMGLMRDDADRLQRAADLMRRSTRRDSPSVRVA